MSRIGRMPIPLPAGVEVAQEGTRITVKGPLGTLERELHPEMRLEREDSELRIVRPSDEPRHRDHRDGERRRHGEDCDAAGDGLRQPPANAGVDHEAHERKKGYQQQHALTISTP